MSRTEKLHQQLSDLEAEFTQLLLLELMKVVNGRHSEYFLRRESRAFQGKQYRSPETHHMEGIEYKIAQLRGKLGQPLAESPLQFVEQYIERARGLPKPWTGSKIALAKEFHRLITRDS